MNEAVDPKAAVEASAPVVKVRLADIADEPSLVSMIREIHAEVGLFKMDPLAVHAMMRRGVMRDKAILGVIGDLGNVRASVLLTVERMWYASIQDGLFLNEIFLFVAPEYRTTDYARRLMEFTKECSDNLGMPLIIGTASNVRTEGKIRLYRRVFSGAKIGESFMYPNNGGS